MKILKKQYISAVLIILFAGYTESYPVIKKIMFTGLRFTDPEFVLSKLKNREGSEFDSRLWDEERVILMNYDIFADVSFSIVTEADGETLQYNFRELPYLLFFPAMKRTDQDGLLLGPGFTIINTFGLAIHQEFLLRETVVPEPFRAREFLYYVNIPELTSLPLSFEFETDYMDSWNSLKLFDEKSCYSFLNFKWRFIDNISLITSGSLLFEKHDDNTPYFTGVDSELPMFAGDGDWDFIPSLGAGVIIDKRERLMNPHRGFYTELGMSVHGGSLGGDADFREYKYDLRGYLPAGNKNIFHANVLGRYRPGTIPGYELYHIGGINSLRSFSPDPSVCDQHEILGTLEYRYEFFANRQISLLGLNGYYGLQGVMGTDYALYWFPGDRFSEGKSLSSVFFGIHLIVPVLERIRLEWGFNGYDRDDKDIKFGVNFGWYEKAYTQGRRIR